MTRYAQLNTERTEVTLVIANLYGGYIFTDGTSTGSVQLYTDEMLEEKDILPITQVAPDYEARTETLSDPVYKINDTSVTRTYTTKALSRSVVDNANAASMLDLREKRNQLLSASDWTVLSDSPLNTYSKTTWKEYRATLRDLPNNLNGTHPKDVLFPNTPNA